jgi:hypothetical protein
MTTIIPQKNSSLNGQNDFASVTYMNSRLFRSIGTQPLAVAASKIGQAADLRIQQVVREPLPYQVLSAEDTQLSNYLESLLERGFSEGLINSSKKTLSSLVMYTARYYRKQLMTPSASPGENASLMFVWSKGEHYLECEMVVSGEVEFFYRNRRTRATWGEDVAVFNQISKQIMEKVAIFGD